MEQYIRLLRRTGVTGSFLQRPIVARTKSNVHGILGTRKHDTARAAVDVPAADTGTVAVDRNDRGAMSGLEIRRDREAAAVPSRPMYLYAGSAGCKMRGG
jgi:hypothetical protein